MAHTTRKDKIRSKSMPVRPNGRLSDGQLPNELEKKCKLIVDDRERALSDHLV